MPFERPSLASLNQRTAADLEGTLEGGDAHLRRSNLRVLATTHAGAVHGLYGYLSWAARQVFPDSAEDEHLERWAAVWGLTRNAASIAVGGVDVTGTPGAVIPTGTQLQRTDGLVYTTVQDATVASGGTASLFVNAETAGETGNAEAGTRLTFITPISGVSSSATVDDSGLTRGADAELDEALRARLLDRIQQPPQGGATVDYKQWATEVSGVTRVWVYPGYLGLGTVGVTFVMDDADDLIPSDDAVAAVQSRVSSKRPVTAEVTVFAPRPVPLNPTIRVYPSSADVKAAVQAELVDLLRREAAPEGTLLVSHIRQAISQAAGEFDHELVSPSENVTVERGELHTLGTITWL